MKKLLLSVVATAALATPALAADLKVVKKAPPPPVIISPWDVAFGAGITSDYIFRGITQSNHQPSVNAYFEPRYNVNKDFQLYAGIAGSSISFPNRAAAEIDLYAGFRPTFGALALDFGAIYYWYPGGQCFNAAFGGECLINADPITGGLPVNGNFIKEDLSFWEVYAKGTYTVNDNVAFGATAFYSPSVLNSGADGTYISGSVKFTAPSNVLPYEMGLYVSAEVGHWFLGTSDSFYAVPGFPNGIPYADYTTWNIGFGITKSVFTLDFRYYDTNLSKADCNAFTSDHTARFSNDVSAINPFGFGSNWCSETFVVSGKFDLTAIANLK
jgi:Bacterial protein of unknown function (Gcw_chp)